MGNIKFQYSDEKLKKISPDQTIVFFFLRQTRSGKYRFYTEKVTWKSVYDDWGKYVHKKYHIGSLTSGIIRNHIKQPLMDMYKRMRESEVVLEVYLNHQGDFKTIMDDLRTAINECSSPEAEHILIDRIMNVVDFTFRHIQEKIAEAICDEQERLFWIACYEEDLEEEMAKIETENRKKNIENYNPFKNTEMVNAINDEKL